MTSKNSGKPDTDRTLIITAVQVDELPIQKIKKVFVAVKSGTSTKKTVELKGKTAPLRWNSVPSLRLDTEDIDSIVSFKLYRKQFIFFKDVLGRVERPLKAFLDPNILELNDLRIALPNGDLVFSVQFENDVFHAAHHLIKLSSEPTPNAAIAKVVDRVEMSNTVMGPATQLRTPFGDLLDSFEPYERLLNRISEIHPIAQVAWFVVSSAYKVVKAQHERDQAICELYIIMMNAYQAAGKDDILSTEQDFSTLFEAMIKQSIECSLFISGYSSGGYLRRLTRMDVAKKIEEFKSSFQNLEQKFTSTEMHLAAATSLETRQVVSEIRDTTSATLLEVRQAVEFANLQATLDLLVPRGYNPLGPRSSCMPKTRRATLAMIVDWIARGEESVMWLHGLAGTGKSSVMGSLSDINLELGASNRLGAFIRFDRATNSDPSMFVRILAYELARFDDRLGKAIVESTRRNPSIVQHTQLSKQFSVLILGPLGSTLCEGMKDEGPITVLVDGVDECQKGEVRRQLLALLLEGFKGYPFMRLIVSSRPEEDLIQTFGDHAASIRRVPLDITSPETKEDIKYFITTRLSTMSKELQEYCRTSDAVSQLSERASGLFIWASTVLKFIEGFPTPERLTKILATEVPTSALKALTTLYQTALGSIASEVGDDNDVQSNMRAVLGVIMVASQSQSIHSVSTNYTLEAHILEGLLVFRNVHHSDMLLNKMGALVGPDEDNNLQLLHKSFDDFLTDEGRCGASWYINIQDHTRNMLSACLLQIFPFLQNPPSLPNEGSPEVHHACVYWIGCVITLNDFESESPNSESQVLVMLKELFRMYLLRWLMICLQLNPGAQLNTMFGFPVLSRAGNKVGQSDLDEDLSDLLFKGAFYSTEQTLSRNCFKWLCCLPSSSPLRQIYLPAYVETAGSNKFSDIMAVMEKNHIPPVGVKDPHNVEIIDIPDEGAIRMDGVEESDTEDGEHSTDSLTDQFHRQHTCLHT